MSKIYKSKQIILGDEKTVKIKRNPIIKLNAERPKEKLRKDEKLENEEIENEELDLLHREIKEEANKNAEKIIQDAKEKAEDIINKAEEEKETIISDSNEASKQIKEDAKKQGYSDGVLEGKTDGLNQMNKHIEEAKEIKQNALKEKKDTAKSLEKEMIQLVITSIKKIINHEIQEDHTLLLNLIEKGVEKSTYTESLTIRVNPEDYDTINSSKNKIYMMTQGIDSIEIKQDPGLKLNSIIIETGSGTINAGVETQITQIEQKFHEILKGEW